MLEQILLRKISLLKILLVSNFLLENKIFSKIFFEKSLCNKKIIFFGENDLLLRKKNGRNVFWDARGGVKGGSLSESRHPPADPPKFSNPSFSNLRFWGKLLVLQALEIFWPLEGECFLPHVSLLQILRLLWRILKMGEKHNKKI